MPLSGTCFISSILSRSVPSTMQVAKFFLNKEYFLWDSTNLLSGTASAAASANLYLMVDPFVNDGPFKLSKFSFRLQPHMTFVRLSIQDPHCLVRPCTTCVETIACFLWLTVFSPHATTFSLGSPSTNRKYPHAHKASWNDCRGPLGPVPSPRALRSFLRPLLPSTC